jgi:phospholipase C
LNNAGLSWKYYGVSKGTPGYVWSPFDAIRHIRFSPQWTTNVLDKDQFANDAVNNSLAAVSWITTDVEESEHPGHDQVPCVGENSSVALINAVMQSAAWNSTVIFVSWDDFGGFYDHVPPPQLDAWGLGPRVGLLIISPFAKSGYIEHTQLEFSSIVRFIEELYGLPFLTARDRNSADIWDAFNFTAPPQAPLLLQAQTCP